jgi:BMFP domain-containing protein YqiC
MGGMARNAGHRLDLCAPRRLVATVTREDFELQFALHLAEWQKRLDVVTRDRDLFQQELLLAREELRTLRAQLAARHVA